MELVYNSDINSSGFGYCDISFTEGNTLYTAVLLSLLCHRRVRPDETDDNITNYRGWWADTPTNKIGSKLWLLRRRKITTGIELLIKGYVEEALTWMIEDGMCASFNVVVEREGLERINVGVTINRYDGQIQHITLENLWKMI